MMLERKKLIDYEEQWLNNHPNKNDDPQEYISFLNGIDDIISKHDYAADDRFVTYGRREFLRKEFSDYLNEKTYSGRGKFNDAFVDLAEYYTGNTWISMSSVPEGIDFHKVDNADNEYRKEGIICKQEIEIIKEMIQEFKSHLKLLNTNINKSDYPIPESLKEFVYVHNGIVYPKQKLPKELEEEYESFVNEVNVRKKGNGTPYAEEFDKEYNKMSSEEKHKVDKMMNFLEEKIGLEDEIMLTKKEQIKLASELLNITYEEIEKNAHEVADGKAIYVSIPEKGGPSLIVGTDGQVLYANSSVSYDKHLEEYNNGRRTPIDAFR